MVLATSITTTTTMLSVLSWTPHERRMKEKVTYQFDHDLRSRGLSTFLFSSLYLPRPIIKTMFFPQKDGAPQTYEQQAEHKQKIKIPSMRADATGDLRCKNRVLPAATAGPDTGFGIKSALNLSGHRMAFVGSAHQTRWLFTPETIQKLRKNLHADGNHPSLLAQQLTFVTAVDNVLAVLKSHEKLIQHICLMFLLLCLVLNFPEKIQVMHHALTSCMVARTHQLNCVVHRQVLFST
jgi:hypothetical protein